MNPFRPSVSLYKYQILDFDSELATTPIDVTTRKLLGQCPAIIFFSGKYENGLSSLNELDFIHQIQVIIMTL